MKNALIELTTKLGQDNRGYRVADTSDVQFEINTTVLEWRNDCPDSVEKDLYWWDPVTSTYRLNPQYVIYPDGPDDTVGPVPEDWVWSWDTDSWVSV